MWCPAAARAAWFGLSIVADPIYAMSVQSEILGYLARRQLGERVELSAA